MKKIYLLTATLLLSLFAFAEESGKCGPRATWSLNDEGVMTISGTGLMITDNFNYSRSNVYKVVIEEGITSIGKATFEKCENLTEVVIPNSVTKIEDYAFYGCKMLDSLALPNSIESIGEYAFGECCSLTSVVIPNSVKQMGSYAFSHCLNLSDVKFSKNITEIPVGCFSKCAFTKIMIPDNITTIKEGAFKECELLEDISFGMGLKIIGGDDDGPLDIYGGAFASCYSLKEITIPNSVSVLVGNAFKNCVGLESVTILSEKLKASSYTFGGCSSIKKITSFCSTPEQLESLGLPHKVVLRIPYAYYYQYQSTNDYIGIKTKVSDYEFLYSVKTLRNMYGTIMIPSNGSVGNMMSGGVSPFSTYASNGETVKIEVLPKSGYKCTQLVMHKGNVAYKVPGQGKKKLAKSKGNALILPDNEFIMPNYDVTISAFFEPEK